MVVNISHLPHLSGLVRAGSWAWGGKEGGRETDGAVVCTSPAPTSPAQAWDPFCLLLFTSGGPCSKSYLSPSATVLTEARGSVCEKGGHRARKPSIPTTATACHTRFLWSLRVQTAARDVCHLPLGVAETHPALRCSSPPFFLLMLIHGLFSLKLLSCVLSQLASIFSLWHYVKRMTRDRCGEETFPFKSFPLQEAFAVQAGARARRSGCP